MKIDPKETFRTFGFMVAIIAFLFLFDMLFVFLSQKRLNDSLATLVQSTLSENGHTHKVVANGDVPKSINIPSIFSNACAMYQLENNGKTSYALIMRVTTVAGPFSAVYTCDNQYNVNFVSFVQVPKRISTILNKTSSKYWHNKAKDVFYLALGGGND